jgi:hypothetical protein
LKNPSPIIFLEERVLESHTELLLTDNPSNVDAMNSENGCHGMNINYELIWMCKRRVTETKLTTAVF